MYFEIEPDEISHLGPKFHVFMRRLLRAEVERCEGEPASLAITTRANDPDGGADAMLQYSPPLPSRWLPPAPVVFQFKSGDIAPRDIENEVAKDEPKGALAEGGSYCIAVGRELAPPQLNNRQKRLAQSVCNVNPAAEHRFYHAEQLAEWANELPTLVYWFRDCTSLLTFEQWASLAEYSNPFVADGRETTLDAIQTWLDDDARTCLALEGLSGVGKSRVVLEALRATASEVVYADHPDALQHSDFWRWVTGGDSHKAVLVVDQCDSQDAVATLKRRADVHQRVKLLTVQTVEELTSPSDVAWHVDKLDEKAMEEVLKQAAPGLSHEARSYVVDVSEGYVNLAIQIARALQELPRPYTVDLVRQRGVRGVLNRLMPSRDLRRTMGALSMMRRVGFEGEVRPELETLADTLRLSIQDMEHAAGRMKARGLVRKAGRYRRVTPKILAVALAEETVEAHSCVLHTLIRMLPNDRAKEAFVDRLADLTGREEVRRFCEWALGEGGLFPDMEDLRGDGSAWTFRRLAAGAPEVALARLEGFILTAALDDLRGWMSWRPEVVWLLRELARPAATFERAANLLLRLAEACGDEFGVGAGDAWTSLFQTFFSGTEVPPLDRYCLLEQALSPTSSPERKQHALSALRKILTVHETGSGPGTPRGAMPPDVWQPRTWGDCFEAKKAALPVLDIALADPEVREQAETVLLEAARLLGRMPNIDVDILERLQRLPRMTQKRRVELRDVLERALDPECSHVSDEGRRLAQTLYEEVNGCEFGDRLRRWVGTWSHSDWRAHYDKGKGVTAKSEELAQEAVAEPTRYFPEAAWLTTLEAEYAVAFARALGKADTEHLWLRALLEAPDEGRQVGVVGAYLIGRWMHGDRGWVAEVINEWMGDEQVPAAFVLEVVRQLPPSEQHVDRLLLLVQQGRLQHSDLVSLSWGPYREEASVAEFRRITEFILSGDDPGSLNGLLMMLSWRLEARPEDAHGLEQVCLTAIAGVPGIKRNDMSGYHFSKIAEHYLHSHVMAIAEVAAAVLDEKSFAYAEDHFLQTLRRAAQLAPREVWHLVGPRLLSEDGLRLRLSLRGNILDAFPAEVLLDWVDAHGDVALHSVASLLELAESPLSPLTRALLERYGGRREVRSTLLASLMSGAFVGHTSEWMATKRAAAETWLNDGTPNVRLFAQEAIEMLDADIARHRQAEEEEWV
ncbi:MAG: hypothetical protein ACOX9R_08385 [Armatimonadota bacterium]